MAKQSDSSLQALHVALQHPALSSAARNICSLAQVCKAWRSAVHQCKAATTHVRFQNASTHTLSGFTAWVPKYGSLVRALSVRLDTKSAGVAAAQYRTALEQMLVLSLQQEAAIEAESHTAAAVAAAAAATTTAAAAAAAVTPSRVSALQLRSYSSNLLYSTYLLSALPAATLTHLDLEFPGRSDLPPAAAFTAVLSSLTALQQLRLASSGLGQQFVSSYIEGLSSLNRLTSLELWRFRLVAGTSMSLLPVMLKQLRMYSESSSMTQLPVNLNHLTALQQLVFHWPGELSGGADLPQQLQTLDVDAARSYSWIVSCCSLQMLTIRQSDQDTEQLSQLAAALPELTDLSLCYRDRSMAHRAAPMWQQLQQLRGLEIDASLSEPAELQAILQGIAASSNLTRLRLRLVYLPMQNIQVCSAMKQLTQLRELWVYAEGSSIAEEDAMALTQLRDLTSLQLLCCGKAVGDTVAVALACEMPQLQLLELQYCGLNSSAALPAIARLQGLRHLDLTGNEGFTDRGLMLLTRLTRLTALGRPCLGYQEVAQPSEEAYQQFWAAVRKSQQQQQQQQQ